MVRKNSREKISLSTVRQISKKKLRPPIITQARIKKTPRSRKSNSSSCLMIKNNKIQQNSGSKMDRSLSEAPTVMIAPEDYVHIYKRKIDPIDLSVRNEEKVEELPTFLIAPEDYEHIFHTKEMKEMIESIRNDRNDSKLNVLMGKKSNIIKTIKKIEKEKILSKTITMSLKQSFSEQKKKVVTLRNPKNCLRFFSQEHYLNSNENENDRLETVDLVRCYPRGQTIRRTKNQMIKIQHARILNHSLFSTKRIALSKEFGLPRSLVDAVDNFIKTIS
ncbi:hypothetical protein SSS_10323 [Sarcoptes scabiei]|uniref:Uncharacterized protein n=2 Tax=Sarcoptes scabiei TaxID=52283 RepID=A0A834R7G4_SARSC|nr:hypothetical protein SSS_10323 [Sarcoptes scabiei]